MSNQQNEHNTSGTESSAPRPGNCALDAIFSALREGARDAKEAAEKAIPKLKERAADAVYWVGYGIGFAASFQWTVAKNLAPESLKSGGRDGVKAGRGAAEKWVDKLRRRQETASADSPGQTGLATSDQ